MKTVLPLFFLGLMILASTARADQREFSIDLWDWTAPCRDLATFKVWAKDMKSIGVTRIEFSAPWNVMEPTPGAYDISFVTDRLAVAKTLGMGLRIRINSYFGAVPGWYKGDMWQGPGGASPQGTPTPVSMTDPRFWDHYGQLCAKIAAACHGEDVYLNCFTGVHAELKWADWWSYDPSTLALWRKTIAQRPAWLIDLVGEAALPDVPPVPAETDGMPDLSPVSIAWIGFREWVWRETLRKFNDTVRAGDPNARTSAPLGESFRRGSAQMSNLDYYGLSRGADQICHSYDFFWHTKDDAWMAAAAVASFQGITGIDNVAFEFDGPALIQNLGYDQAHQMRIADAALSQGAGLKAANYSYDRKLPSQWPVLVEFGKRIATTQPAVKSPKSETILLFVSKWANYCYREKTEWLHDAQFGAWEMLREHGLPVRFICEDNLKEDLSGYRGLYVAFSPAAAIPSKPRAALAALESKLPSIVELSEIPASPTARSVVPKLATIGRSVTIEYPLAYHWLRDDRAASENLLNQLLQSTWNKP